MALGKQSRQEHADRCMRPVSSAAQPASTLRTLDNSRTSLELRAYLSGGFLRPLSSPRRQKPHSLRCSRLVPASTPESVWAPASVNIQIPPTPPAPVQKSQLPGGVGKKTWRRWKSRGWQGWGAHNVCPPAPAAPGRQPRWSSQPRAHHLHRQPSPC